MKNIIVGTAGHIDHGKTALVKALTGTDADRWREEKRRGITIDLGFAHLQLTKDIRLGFIDVPGHERFVRNMLAGAAGIDLVLFVISAEESIKPQTREHFDICRLLGVKAGIVVLTKADLVDPDILDLVSLEVDDFVAGSFLENAPKIAVGSTTGLGIEALKTAIAKAAGEIELKSAGGWFRLPIDRAFTMKGHGTVVTGTLVSGSVRREAEVELHPSGKRLRVRGVQVFGQSEERAGAGLRTALNVPDIAVEDVGRGMTLTEPGRFRSVTVLDCRLDLLRSAKPLKNRAPVHFHLGSAEVEAEVRFLDRRTTLQPGEWAWARIVLEAPLLALPGDRFIVRMFSPVVTIGGGLVADVSGHRYKATEDRSARLKTLLEGSPQARVALLAGERPDGVTERDTIAWTGLPAIPQSPELERAGEWVVLRRYILSKRTQFLDVLRAFHKANPLLPGMPRHDLKSRVMPKAAPEVFELAMRDMNELAAEQDLVRLKSHKVVLKQDEEQARTLMENSFETAGLTTPALSDVLVACGVEPSRARSLLQQLLKEGRLVRIADDLVMHRSAVDALKLLVAARKGRRFTVPEFKEWTGISRKYAIPLLEFLDAQRITRRDGNERLVI